MAVASTHPERDGTSLPLMPRAMPYRKAAKAAKGRGGGEGREVFKASINLCVAWRPSRLGGESWEKTKRGHRLASATPQSPVRNPINSGKCQVCEVWSHDTPVVSSGLGEEYVNDFEWSHDTPVVSSCLGEEHAKDDEF